MFRLDGATSRGMHAVGVGLLSGLVMLPATACGVGDAEEIAASHADFTDELFPTLDPERTMWPDYTPPPGFPTSSVRDLPPDPEPNGEPRTVNTVYGISYTVPADWDVGSRAVTQWPDGTDYRYSGGARGGRGYCPLADGNSTARTAMRTGNSMPLDEAAQIHVRTAEAIWSTAKSVSIDGPQTISTISGEQGVRYTAKIEGIPRDDECTPTAETFDVVALRGYSNAETVVFVGERMIGVEPEFSETVMDDVIASLRRTDS